MSIISHFDKYPLITKNYADYLLYRELVMMMSRKEHLTNIGVQTIINIRATMNRGLTPALIEAFPETVMVKRPLVQKPIIPHSQWVAGFASGDGCFWVSLRSSSTHMRGHRVTLVFVLTQHIRDKMLMKALVDYLGCGNIYTALESVELKCTDFKDILEKIMPFSLNILF